MKPRFEAWRVLLAILALSVCYPLAGQSSPAGRSGRPAGGRYSLLSLSVSPYLSLPVGADADVFGVGGGLGIAASYRIPRLPMLKVGGGLDYAYLSTDDPATSASLVGIGAEAAASFQVLPILALELFGNGGWFLGLLNGPGAAPEGNPFLAVGTRLDFDVADS